mmetsp:Transcript_14440/g.49791  ORF Transcript_14440/g.49791 Transcript_14440/m.49791 type:complete len:418 (+) Transcript_14440:890-2143(+)
MPRPQAPRDGLTMTTASPPGAAAAASTEPRSPPTTAKATSGDPRGLDRLQTQVAGCRGRFTWRMSASARRALHVSASSPTTARRVSRVERDRGARTGEVVHEMARGQRRRRLQRVVERRDVAAEALRRADVAEVRLAEEVARRVLAAHEAAPLVRRGLPALGEHEVDDEARDEGPVVDPEARRRGVVVDGEAVGVVAVHDAPARRAAEPEVEARVAVVPHADDVAVAQAARGDGVPVAEGLEGRAARAPRRQQAPVARAEPVLRRGHDAPLRRRAPAALDALEGERLARRRVRARGDLPPDLEDRRRRRARDVAEGRPVVRVQGPQRERRAVPRDERAEAERRAVDEHVLARGELQPPVDDGDGLQHVAALPQAHAGRVRGRRAAHGDARAVHDRPRFGRGVVEVAHCCKCLLVLHG